MPSLYQGIRLLDTESLTFLGRSPNPLNQGVVQSIPHPPRASGAFFVQPPWWAAIGARLSRLTVSPLLRYALAMRSKTFGLLVCLVLLASSLLVAQQPTTAPVVNEANNPASPKNVLLVSSYPDRAPLAISLADLKALPHITVTIHNSHTNADETYSGVRVADLFGKLGAPLGNALR